jgi:hypothetical protein
MISIVICSVNPVLLEKISENIRDTVGVSYEILAIDNRKTPKGLAAVYNLGAKSARYDQVCFVHEDVKFNTSNWGTLLLEHFSSDPELGLVGVAGSAHKPKMMSGWGAQGLERRFAKMNFIQHFPTSGKPSVHEYSNTDNEELARVVCLDGLFLASRKSVLQEIPFDEELLGGFHGYDIDISIAIGRKYKVAVTYLILLEHFSEGSLNVDWLESSLLVHRKWRSVLPLTVGMISKEEKVFCEKETFRFWFTTFRSHLTLRMAFQLLHTGELPALDFREYYKVCSDMIKSYYKGI